MSILTVMGQLAEDIGKLGLKEALNAIEELVREAEDPAKRAVLGLVADAIEKHGPDGLSIARRAVDRILRGKDADLSFASLRARSDALAVLQNREADNQSEAREFLERICKVLGAILAAVVKAIVS